MEKTAKANAKINLYLNVCGKREDGYHEIETVMQEISLCDEVSVGITENTLGGNRITLSSNDSRVPLNEKNIAYKCAGKFLEFTNTRLNMSFFSFFIDTSFLLVYIFYSIKEIKSMKL